MNTGRTGSETSVAQQANYSRRLQRDWMRPWSWSIRRWVLVLIFGMITSPFITRWFCLFQVPDVPLAFDVEEFLSAENVAKEDDAFVHYQAAVSLMRATGAQLAGRGMDLKTILNASRATIANPDAPWDPSLEHWVRTNQSALDEYRQGSEKPSAKGLSLRTAHSASTLFIHNDLRAMAELAELAAIQCETTGDMQAAWEWRRANLRCTRHAETPRLALSRLAGIRIRTIAFHGITRWSGLALVSAAQIREARMTVESEAHRCAPSSDFLKGEYLIFRNTLRRADAPVSLLPTLNNGIAGHQDFLIFKRIALWSFGEPEISLRLQRQLLANNFDCIDLPLYQRRKSIPDRNALVFDDDPANRGSWQRMSASSLLNSLNRSQRRGPADDFVWTISRPDFDVATRLQDARLAAIQVVLAAQEFRRDRNEFPSSLEQLVPEYLPSIPLDPMSEVATSMRYRCDSVDEAVVWSVGRNGVDDEGEVSGWIKGEDNKDEGFRFHYGGPGNTAKNSVHQPEAMDPGEPLK